MYYESVMSGRVMNCIKALAELSNDKHKIVMNYTIINGVEHVEYGLEKIGKVIMEKKEDGSIKSTYSFYNVNRRIKRLERKLGAEVSASRLYILENGDIEQIVTIDNHNYSFKSSDYRVFIKQSRKYMCDKEKDSFMAI